MTRFDNFCEKLRAGGMRVLSSIEEFNREKTIRYECQEGHLSELSVGSFINKTSPKNVDKLRSLCADCNGYLCKKQEVDEIMGRLGFVLISLKKYNANGDWMVAYRCSCGNESATDFRNLKKPTRTGSCPKCQNNDNRADYNTIRDAFQARGCVLLTPGNEYRNNKQPLAFRCVCGAESAIVYHDLVRGRLCRSCKFDRTKETSIKKYGVDNPSKCDEIKQKIVETTMANHGVPYAQQNPEIREKTTQTCLEKYGVLRAFMLPEVFEKIRRTHFKKYGVEFPLQSKHIQDKISMVFLDKLGAPRPFLSPQFLARMKEKYGHEWFCCTDAFRQCMLEKYGSEYYVASDHCRKQMLEKYGSEHYVTSDHCRKQMLEKYGSEHYVTSDHCRERMLERYGSEYYVASDHCRERMLERYGSEYYVASDHCREQMLERYGSEHYVTSDHYRKTMLEKYGVESPMQCPDLFRRAQASSFCRRPYVSPDGKIFMVLGYEGVALDDILMTEGVKLFYAGEDENIPIFQYVGDDNETHHYYPDIYIPHENRVIEVKSVYTYNRDPEKTLCKALSVSENHLFELRLYDDKKTIVEILECRNGIFYSHTIGLLELGKKYEAPNKT